MRQAMVDTAGEAIALGNATFMDALRQGDAAVLAALYTRDGQLLPETSEPLVGRDAIQSFWHRGIEMGLRAATLESVEIEDHGTTAFEIGRYTMYEDGDRVIDVGKYIVIWKQVHGLWKIHRHMLNSSLPPRA
jgi:uncharacterized protein (TIGR02246 family)